MIRPKRGFQFLCIILLLVILSKIFDQRLRRQKKSVVVISNPMNLFVCEPTTKILVVIPCLLRDFQLRQFIRGSFGHCAQWKHSNYRLLFYVGHVTNLTTRETRQLEEERLTYKDIEWDTSFIDGEENYVRKVMNSLLWISRYCPSVKYVVKVKSDAFLFVDHLVRRILSSMKEDLSAVTAGPNKTPNAAAWHRKYTLVGHFHNKTRPIRDKRQEYYVPLEEYELKEYPLYADSVVYALNRATLMAIKQNFYNYVASRDSKALLRVEDALITGVLLDNIQSLHRVPIGHICFTPCNASSAVVAMRGVWNSERIADTGSHRGDCYALFEEIRELDSLMKEVS